MEVIWSEGRAPRLWYREEFSSPGESQLEADHRSELVFGTCSKFLLVESSSGICQIPCHIQGCHSALSAHSSRRGSLKLNGRTLACVSLIPSPAEVGRRVTITCYYMLAHSEYIQ